MDRYDRVMMDIRQKTDDEIVVWNAVNPEHYSEVILNTHRVIRAFTAEYLLGRKEYRLLFIEKKIEIYDDIADWTTEALGFQLFVLEEDGKLILNLYDGVVERDDLLRLSGLIDEHNDRAKEFFKAFDQLDTA